jgi:hypothetical protein
MITIRKSIAAGHEKLGKRIISGNELVVKNEGWLKSVKS